MKLDCAAVGIDDFEAAGHPAEDGIWWVGVFTGLVDDIPSVAELVSRIASEAEKIIHERLSELSLRVVPGVYKRRSLRREGNICQLSVF